MFGTHKQKKFKLNHINTETDAYKHLLVSGTCDSSATAIRHCLVESTGANNTIKLFTPSFLCTPVKWFSKSNPSNKDDKNKTINIMRGTIVF